MRIAYFDCSSGISGDMCLGALVDAGVPLKKLQSELRKIPFKGYELRSKEARRAGFRATKVDVVQKSEARSQKPEARRWRDIERIIRASSLSEEIKKKGLRVFKRLFEAEAKVHGEKFTEVHLHELGAIDCIVDIFGTIIGLGMLGIEKVYASPVNLGSGSVKTAHGTLPVPAPATAEILRWKMEDGRCKIYSDGANFELTTPTGAAIIRELASDFGNMPEMFIENIGIGAGGRDFKGKPNVLRVFVGELLAISCQLSASPVTIIETNIDDMNPQAYEYAMERLFSAGVLDVFLTQLIMKKGRPGIKLTVICESSKKDDLMRIILEETTSIGLRFYEAGRKTLSREIKKFDTKLGKIRFKVSRLGDELIKVTPEYEDCKRIAGKTGRPLLEVINNASAFVSKRIKRTP